MWKKFDKHSAIYHTKNKIENFQFTIELKTISSLLKVPKFKRTSTINKIEKSTTFNENKNEIRLSENDEDQELDNDNKTSSRSNNGGNQDNDDDDGDGDDDDGGDDDGGDDEDHKEQVTIQWQEKILSQNEINLYENIENCSNDVQKTYHNWIKTRKESLDKRQKIGGKIFTYVNEDNFILADDYFMRNEKLITKKTNYNKKIKELNPPLGIEDEQPEIMHVFADLNPNILLFTVQWFNSHGIMVIYPDFNGFEKNSLPYYIEIDSDYRHLYSYIVRNSSINLISSMKYDNFHLSLPNFQIDDNKKIQGLFDVPSSKTSSYRALCLFEIENGYGFDYDRIHVKYHFKIPEKIQLDDDNSTNDENLIGSTHSSTSTNGLWKFGHCFQFLMTLNNSNDSNFHDQSINGFFEVISIDSWLRERNEGFCYFNIPLVAGFIQKSLNCYRINYGFYDKIQRYFIGGRRKFQLEEFYNGGIEGFLNRYTCKVITTGILNVRYSMILQKSVTFSDLKIFKKKKLNGMTLEDIRKAYQKARRRLEATILD